MVKGANTEITNQGSNTGTMVGENTGVMNIYPPQAISSKMPSLIGQIVRILGESWNEKPDIERNLDPYKPEEKLDYNNVIKYKDIINNFAAYYNFCDECLDKQDNLIMGSKSKIMANIEMLYKMEKGELLLQSRDLQLSDIENVRGHADGLIDGVTRQIMSRIDLSAVNFAEDIDLGVACFVCYCFMECRILEKPI